MHAATAPQKRWLLGPIPDLLLGCGGLYFLMFCAFAFVSGSAMAVPLGIAVLVFSLLLSTPHYGATILRVYEHRRDRRRYTWFAVHATIAIFALFVVGVQSAVVGSWLLTIYLMWSPWHYSGQNYGIALMLMRRRGIAVDPLAKRLVYATFVLPFVMHVLQIHVTDATSEEVIRTYAAQQAGQLQLVNLELPMLREIGVPLVGVAYAAALAATVFVLSRRASWRDLGPSALLLVMQSLWFAVPTVVRHWEMDTGISTLDPSNGAVAFAWIASGHAVQYLWVTGYYASAAPEWTGPARYYTKALAAGAALWTLPLLVLAPWQAGGLAGHASFYLVLTAAINIHHFVLDGAIWKLRDSRIAQVLLRSEAETVAPGAADDGRTWGRRLVWTVAAAGVALSLFQHQLQIRERVAAARDDLQALARVYEGLAWIGLDNPEGRIRLAAKWLVRGETALAAHELRASHARAPSADLGLRLASLERGLGDRAGAVRALETALEAEPGRLDLLQRLGVALLENGEPQRAREQLMRAIAIDPSHLPTRKALAHANLRIERAQR